MGPGPPTRHLTQLLSHSHPPPPFPACAAAQYSPAANHTFTALVTGNRGTAGLHRAEPKVLDFLGGGDDDDDDI